MPFISRPEAMHFVFRAQEALGLTQETLGELLGVSRRTVSRWYGKNSVPQTRELHVLARAVHPKNAELAAKLAEEGGETLESLGLAVPAPRVESKEPPSPPPRSFPPTRLMVESIVCAAAEAMQTQPAAVRDVLRSAFARARGLGLTVEEVDDALRPEQKATIAREAREITKRRKTRTP